MKGKYIYLSIFYLFFLSCKVKEEPKLDQLYWGEAFAYLNDELWEPKPVAYNLNDTAFTVEFVSYTNEMRSASLGIKSLSANRSIINKEYFGKISSYVLLDHDAILCFYKPNCKIFNRVKITAFNEMTREVKGTFEASFSRGCANHGTLPDTLRITKGVFHTRIVD
jgi:hypothetical protein